MQGRGFVRREDGAYPARERTHVVHILGVGSALPRGLPRVAVCRFVVADPQGRGVEEPRE